jgi:hypothetical protein
MIDIVGGPYDGGQCSWEEEHICAILETTSSTGNFAYYKREGDKYVFISIYNKDDLKSV